MSENETQTTTEERVTPETEQSAPTITRSKKNSPNLKWVITAVIVVALIILGVLYKMEKEGRSSTHLFATLIERQVSNTVVATVNGEKIINADLSTSIEQFGQMAAAQGVDITSAEAQAEMRNQALEVLVNTKLLKQEAAKREISVTDEEVTTRLNALREEIGGEEVLAERMASLGIDNERLQTDIKDELTIQKLLDGVFAEANIQITEEEITSVYEGAGGAAAGLPALEEVRAQVEEQVRASKEQVAINDFLTKLKEGAEIVMKE